VLPARPWQRNAPGLGVRSRPVDERPVTTATREGPRARPTAHLDAKRARAAAQGRRGARVREERLDLVGLTELQEHAVEIPFFLDARLRHGAVRGEGRHFSDIMEK
jgi:hypothetical protein